MTQIERHDIAAPIAPSGRNTAIDTLRGFGVLGILIMNIQYFSMIQGAYFNPTAYGDLTGINMWVWILSHIFADQKFMTVFSILFGAGVIMIVSRIEAGGGSALKIYYRRIIMLILIGLAHAYLLWSGDILVAYGCCGLVVYLFRKARPLRLLIFGMLTISISTAIYLFFGWSMKFWPPEAITGMMEFWKPTSEMIQIEIAARQDGWLGQLGYRIPNAIFMQTFVFAIWAGWRSGGLMLIGMALYKFGVITGERSRKFYAYMAVLGFIVGLPLVSYGIVRNFRADWSIYFSFFYGIQFNYWGSLFIGMAYIGVIMLICKTVRFKNTVKPLAAVGQMALTNYLFQTLICTTIFNGHGFGLFGEMPRYGQILLVFGIWIIQLIISPIWLSHFRFGPLEWFWRSLTYGKFQPMRLHHLQS
jgi:uncharacterized protein